MTRCLTILIKPLLILAIGIVQGVLIGFACWLLVNIAGAQTLRLDWAASPYVWQWHVQSTTDGIHWTERCATDGCCWLLPTPPPDNTCLWTAWVTNADGCRDLKGGGRPQEAFRLYGDIGNADPCHGLTWSNGLPCYWDLWNFMATNRLTITRI